MIVGEEASRREALRRGMIAGGVVLGASTAAALARVRTSFAAADGDAAVLRTAVKLENTAVAAYDVAIRSGLLDRKLLAAAKLFKRHEQEHAAALSAALKARGETPRAGVDAKLLAPLTRARSQAGVVRFASELETMAVAAYYDAHKKLRDGGLLKTVAQIMSNEGQHLVVLRQALGHDPVPDPFETGKRAG